MSLNNISLPLDVDPEVAWALIELLDQLRDSIAFTYTEDIQTMMREEQEYLERQQNLPFDDPLDF
jgi:hypothetical protein